MGARGRRQLQLALCAVCWSQAGLASAVETLRDTKTSSVGFTPLDTFYCWFGVHSGVSWLDGSVARQQDIGDFGPNFYLSLGVSAYDLVTLSGSWGAAFPKDRERADTHVQ